MQKILYVFLIFAVSAGCIFGQETFFSAGNTYQVYSDISQENANEVLARLEAYVDVFEDMLHYDRTELSAPLKVKIKSDYEAYAEYISEYVESPKDIFLFLQYTDPKKSELVGYNPGDDTFESKLIHHSFIQYFKSFVPNPPLWLQKGLAIYLEKSFYSSVTNSAEYNVNLEWTKTLKKYLIENPDSGNLPVNLLLTIDVDTANENIQEFYAQSWGVVHFLLNSPQKEYNRIIWEILLSLSPEASRDDNQAIAMDRGFSWTQKDLFIEDYTAFVEEIKTYSDLVREGISLYGERNYTEAVAVFNKAITVNSEYDVPYYYLGLLHYELQDYAMAEYYYQESLERGSDPSLTYYALGIAAYSENSYDRALEYLNTVIEEDPEGYGVKAMELIEKIDSEVTGDSSGA